MYSHLTFPLLDFVVMPQWLLTRYMVPPAGVHKPWGLLWVKCDRIVQEVYRNVIKNMARSIEAVIKAKRGTTVHWPKNRLIEGTTL